MRRAFLRTLTVVGMAALAAVFVVHLYPGGPDRAPLVFARVAESATRALAARPSETASRPGDGTMRKGAPLPRRPAAPVREGATLLLNEPVSVLQGGDGGWKSLPKGTSMHVVSADRSFLEVESGALVVEVPRSAFVKGAVSFR